MLDERFVFLGAALSFYGALSYLKATLKGQVKPNRISWFFWALAPLIAFAAELDKGVGLVSLVTFTAGFNPLLVFLASFVNKEAYWELKKLDYFYGSLSLFGLILWQITGEGNLAILFSLISDASASIPTVIKSYHQPETESSKIYLLSMINAGISFFIIKDWTFAHWGYPVYIFTMCALLYSLIKFKLGLVLKKKLKD